MSATKYKAGGSTIWTEWRVYRVEGGRWRVTRRDHHKDGSLGCETHYVDDAAQDQVGQLAALCGWSVNNA